MAPAAALLASLAAALGVAQAANAPRQASQAESCLQGAGVPIVAKSSSVWRVDAAAYNLRVPVTPAAIAVPTAVQQIQAAVSCGARLGLKVTPKGGGHGYASHGLGGEDGHLVVQLDRMSGVSLNTTSNVATVQAGARLGKVATELFRLGARAISHGTCPGVGVSGHVLHGGFGFSSHTRGLALDWLVGATVVLANSTVVRASATENPDLFWALRGAGSNFGIVASLEFDTFPAPSTVTTFQIALPNWRSEQTVLAGIQALRDFAVNKAPNNLNMRLFGQPTNFVMEGAFYGTLSELRPVLDPLVAATGGTLTSNTGGWLASLQAYTYGDQMEQTVPYNVHASFYAKSLELKDLTGQPLANFVRYWQNTARNQPAFGWYFQLDIHGGATSAVSRVAANATAYAHRDKLFMMQFQDRIAGGGGGPYNKFLDGWISSVTDSISRPDWGMYINYADTILNRTAAQELYYGQNLPRLRQVKAKFDPKELFYYPQSVQPAA
ncbi:hypothetical protein RB594_007136 [Gaeumannomyces avenae]